MFAGASLTVGSPPVIKQSVRCDFPSVRSISIAILARCRPTSSAAPSQALAEFIAWL